ncbi:hypothetical protein QR680_002469 [Steinernema hermaphroditum]|uniref:J domain-containing protein n=1 Tax=Steinernema hermaphroditum TaxID=289476 RepID=A0AA39H2V6_9BILA|nr:hypothetical protein QR680_002469 [Steinernema hermaphroditum]
MVQHANKDEAEVCLRLARRAMNASSPDLAKVKKMVEKAKRLNESIDVSEFDLFLSDLSTSSQASSDNGYAHDDHYQSQTNLNNGDAQSSQAYQRPSRARKQSTGNATTERPRTQSGARKGVDYTQEDVDNVDRIRHCKDYYETLGVQKTATESELKRKYRALALKLHPDKCKAPHTAEAFKAVGNAYAVLSDAEKRKKYDLYGNQENGVRRGNNDFNDYDIGHGFEADISPEEIFNMFFGGGYPSGAMNRGGFRYYFHTGGRPAQQEGALNGGGLLQLLPLFLIFFGLIFQLLVNAPAYSLHRDSTYTELRHTQGLNVAYYVAPNFEENYSGRIRQVERQVEDDYIAHLRMQCYKEKNQRETLLWRAKLQGDRERYESAMKMPLPSCVRLESMYR